MRLYGAQLAPLLETLVERGGASGLRRGGSFHERALARAHIRRWATQPDPPGGFFRSAGRHAPVSPRTGEPTRTSYGMPIDPGFLWTRDGLPSIIHGHHGRPAPARLDFDRGAHA